MSEFIGRDEFNGMRKVLSGLQPELTVEERGILDEEISLLDGAFGNRDELTFDELAAATAESRKLHDTSGHALLNRIHQLAKKGCLASNLGIYTFAETVVKKRLALHHQAELNLTVSQGHTAPAFYVAKYFHDRFPLSFLYTLNSGVLPGVVTARWGFQNTLNRPLGIGLANCVGKAMHEHVEDTRRHTFNCLIGDGEMQEGLTLELIALISKYRLQVNIILNQNDYGIDPLDQEIDCQAFFASQGYRTRIVSGEDPDCIEQAFREVNVDQKQCPNVIILKTTKGINSLGKTNEACSVNPKHSYSSEEKTPPKCPQLMGPLLETKLTGVPHIILSPDMAGRFHFKENQIANPGMRESASVALLAGFPAHYKKIIGTDDQFFMYGMGAIEQNLISGIENFWILASKNWGVWNGSNYFINQMLAFDQLKFFEASDPAELDAFVDFGLKTNANIVFSLFDSVITPEKESMFPRELFKVNAMTCVGSERPKRKAVVAFGFAGHYIPSLVPSVPDADFFYVNSFPLPKEEIEKLGAYEEISFIEFNRSANGIGANFVRPLQHSKVNLIGADEDFLFCPEKGQIQQQHLDLDSLLKRL